MAKSHDFITDHHTVIPEIQRDYVQGADRWKFKREAFVNTLLNALKSNETCMLDFIYGVKAGDDFIPFDGQQRLTTLHLLGWMLANRSTNEYAVNPISYVARHSSREFCDKLFADRITGTSSPSRQLRERIWYAEEWDFDPTVKAMLEMLDYLDGRLKELTQEEIEIAAERFFCDSPIEFEKLDNVKVADSDDLYIKINARGKPLTDFEHWKASFINMLRQNHYSAERNGTKLCDDFEDRIEHEWCDVFWRFALEEKVSDDEYPCIDRYFMRFFYFVTNILWSDIPDFKGVQVGDKNMFVMENLDEGDREKIWMTVYGNENNVLKLFDILDAVTLIMKKEQETGNFFDAYLFSTVDESDAAISTETRVNIFDECPGTDLFHRLVRGEQMALRPQILLWGVLSFMAKYRQASFEETQAFIRVWWSFLQTRRQRIAKTLSVNPDVRWEDMNGIILKALTALLMEQDVYASAAQSGYADTWTEMAAVHQSDALRYALDVIPLQNHPWLLYDLVNLSSLVKGRDFEPGGVCSAFMAFVSLDNKVRIRSLIECGFDGCLTKDHTENFFTYGIEGGWPYILTDRRGAVEKPLHNLMTGNRTGRSADWMANFIYKELDILSDVPRRPFSSFYNDRSGSRRILYAVRAGSSMGLRGYQLDPIAYVVAKKAGVRFADEVHPAYHVGESGGIMVDVYNKDSTRWCITFPEQYIQMECIGAGWRVSVYDDTKQWPERLGAFMRSGDAFRQKSGTFDVDADGVVADLPDMDCIDTGVELLKTILGLL